MLRGLKLMISHRELSLCFLSLNSSLIKLKREGNPQPDLCCSLPTTKLKNQWEWKTKSGTLNRAQMAWAVRSNTTISSRMRDSSSLWERRRGSFSTSTSRPTLHERFRSVLTPYQGIFWWKRRALRIPVRLVHLWRICPQETTWGWSSRRISLKTPTTFTRWKAWEFSWNRTTKAQTSPRSSRW